MRQIEMGIVVDKKSLFIDGFIVELVSCVNAKMTPIYVWYLGSIVPEKLGKDTRGRETASSSDKIYWKLAVF